VTGEDLERQLVALAGDHIRSFQAYAARIDADPALIAHALWLLAEAAENRRQEILGQGCGAMTYKPTSHP
jgi:hypothetical protein